MDGDMSYQVNFKLSFFNCDYYETEIIEKLQKELHEACMLVSERNSLRSQCGLSRAEVAYLPK